MIYLDYNATTPVDARVAAAMTAAVNGELAGPFANPSSSHSLSRAPHALLALARRRIASLLDAGSPDEILFESGGSESINHDYRHEVL